MGTRSRIGLALGPDKIISVYCHYDGYIQSNGRILKQYYTTKEAVGELIDGGGMSCLRTLHTWNSEPLKRKIIKDDGTEEIVYMTHDDGTWMMKEEKETPGPQYYTERGEDVEVLMSTFDEFMSDSCGEEWCYLFTPGDGWQCWKLGYGQPGSEFYEVTTEYDMITEEPLKSILVSA